MVRIIEKSKALAELEGEGEEREETRSKKSSCKTIKISAGESSSKKMHNLEIDSCFPGGRETDQGSF